MNAIQTVESVEQYSRVRSGSKRNRNKKTKNRTYTLLTIEITAKLVINGLLSAVAVTALLKLLPYHAVQQDKLKEVRIEVQQTEERVNKLRENFRGNFDPSQAKVVMQKQSTKVDPSQRRIIFLP